MKKEKIAARRSGRTGKLFFSLPAKPTGGGKEESCGLELLGVHCGLASWCGRRSGRASGARARAGG